MTPRKPLPEIARCACGLCVDNIESEAIRYRVWCFCGWKGPWRATVRAAILAWNRVMTTPWLLKTLRRNICDRIEEAMRETNGVLGKLDAAFKMLGKIRRGE